MRFPLTRFTMRQMMLVVAAFGVGLGLSPSASRELAVFPPVALGIAWINRWPVLLLGVVLLMLCALVEIRLGFPIPGSIYASVAILLSWPLWSDQIIRRRSSRLILLIAASAVILTLFLVLVPWTTRKPFLLTLSTIKPGMTSAEAIRIMGAYTYRSAATGSDRQRLSFRHSQDPAFAKDHAYLTVHNGKVVDVDFIVE